MEKVVVPTLALLLCLSIFPPVFTVQLGQIKNPYDLIVATIEGGMPETADPAWCYDTTSGELIFNVYETLLFYDGECVDRFVPQLATDWRIENITGTTSPEGLDWYYRYTFTIREDIPFHGGDWGPAGTYMLTPEDIEYSIERGMVQDRHGSPQWMFYEPLLNNWGAEDLGNLSSTEDVVMVGKMIDHAVESNSTHAWFNLAFPGAYAAFLQVLSQSWSSILSRRWVNEYVIGTLGRPDWNGEWGDYSDWINFHDPEVSPLDDPEHVMCGTGPYQLETYSSAEEYWTIVRFPEYWRGWPADYPAPPYPTTPTKVKPAGYLERVKVTWRYVWETRRDRFLAGYVDICAVPRMYMDQVLEQPGVGARVRCIYPLPALYVSNLFFTFDIDPLTPYGTINDPGVFTADGIPRDFFGNPDWGIHNRKAFAHAFDYDSFLQDAFGGEAIQPPTAIILGLPYYDLTIPKYTYNLTKAEEEFELVPGLWETGFTLTILYNWGNLARETAGKMIEDAVESLNPKFHVDVVTMGPWGTSYLPAMVRRQLAVFIIGWLADYPDPHNFAVPFYASYGPFTEWQAYSNPVMDELIERGIREHDPEVRRQIYHDIQVLAIEDCPSVPLYKPLKRHFERDWIVGWYYTPAYPGVYAYHLWKQCYVPHVLTDGVPTHEIANLLPCDVNYDGKVNTIDITIVTQSFGSSFGPPIHPRWHFRVDIDNNRVVNIIDIAAVAKYFKKTSAIWAPP